MTFKHYVEAAKSSWNVVSNASILLAVLAGAGINAIWAEVPTLAAMVACLLFYVVGYLIACYQSEKTHIESEAERPEISESTITLADHEAAIEREKSRLRASIEEKDAEISSLKKLVESYDRAERERFLRDMMDDCNESGAEDVAMVPQLQIDAAYDEAMRWMGRDSDGI